MLWVYACNRYVITPKAVLPFLTSQGMDSICVAFLFLSGLFSSSMRSIPESTAIPNGLHSPWNRFLYKDTHSLLLTVHNLGAPFDLYDPLTQK